MWVEKAKEREFMSKKFIPVLFVLLLLAGCSANKDLPQNTENSFSSVSNTSEVLQDETLTDEPTSTIADSTVSSTETEVIAEPTESRETVSSESNQQKETVPEPTENKPAETKPAETKPTEPIKVDTNPVTEPTKEPETVYQVPDRTEVERKVAEYINSYRSSSATVLSGLTAVARYRSNQLVSNFAHSDGIDVCNALQYGEYVDMTQYGMSESDSYYQGYNREAIAKGNFTGTADEIAKRIADGFKNSSSHWSYLGSSEYSYIAVGCTYDEASSMWYCCICVSSKNYGG